MIYYRQAELHEVVRRRLEMRGFHEQARWPELRMACVEAAEDVVRCENIHSKQEHGKNVDDETTTAKPAVRPGASLF